MTERQLREVVRILVWEKQQDMWGQMVSHMYLARETPALRERQVG